MCIEILKTKVKFYYVIPIAILLIGWLVYGIQTFNLFKEISELTTPGASYVIRMLEFTNYRGQELSNLLILYFILVSLTNIVNLYFYFKIEYKIKISMILISINVILLAIISFIANIFWLVYVLLFILSVLIITASLYVARMIWGVGTSYEQEDIIFKSNSYNTIKETEIELRKKLETYNLKEPLATIGEIYKVAGVYYFEVYANKKIVLDNRGEIIVNENK